MDGISIFYQNVVTDVSLKLKCKVNDVNTVEILQNMRFYMATLLPYIQNIFLGMIFFSIVNANYVQI